MAMLCDGLSDTLSLSEHVSPMSSSKRRRVSKRENDALESVVPKRRAHTRMYYYAEAPFKTHIFKSALSISSADIYIYFELSVYTYIYIAVFELQCRG